jgi:glyoxylase-like metal-dependent hydrolase (beta-lactamase superfamily II)
MKVRFVAFSLAMFALMPLAPAFAQQQQGPPVRSIERLTGDLYRVQNNDHYTVFLVTPAGIILADPINVGLADWLKGQLAERFPNTPVRYVLYSHHHQDHASGAAAFNDTAELVAHENFNAALKASVSQNEAQVKRFAAVIPPESTYSGRRTITLGGKSVEMIYPGTTAHANDLTVLYFPAERVVFGVDFMAAKQVPGTNSLSSGAPTAITDNINALKAVETLDFTIMVPGHGPTGTKADLVAFRQYFENLASRVSAGIAAGRTVEQLQQAKIMDEYKDWVEYDEDNDVNIANAYKILSAQKR